jgi:hypothetical protein
MGVSLATSVVAVVSLSAKDHEMIPLMLIVWSLTALGITVGVPDVPRAALYAPLFGTGALVLAAFKHVRERQLDDERRVTEEKSKRTDRILADWRAFVSNPAYVKALYLLETNGPELRRLSQPLSFEDYRDWKNPLDQIFEFLQSLAFSIECKHVERSAVAQAVGWYFRQVQQLPHVKEYCNRSGYHAIVKLASEIVAEATHSP